MDFLNLKTTIKKIFLPSESLSKKTAQGTLWLFFLRILDQAFNFIKTIILVHILLPQDFGLFAIAFIVISVMEGFSQIGFTQALIQKKESIEEYLNTAWVIQITRGVLLSVILFLLAPLLAYWFASPGVVVILRVVSLSILLQGFANIGIVYFQKEIQLHKYVVYQLLGILVDFSATVIFGLLFRNVWALVAGFIAGDMVRLLVSYAIHKYRPKFHFEMAKAKELFHFGKWIMGTNMLSFFIMQSDNIFVGKILGVANLGLYQVGGKISSITNAEVISGAIMPMYAKIQHDKEKMREAYIKIIKIFVFLLAPVAAGVVAITPGFTALFLGEEWLPSVIIMQLLAVSGFIWFFAVASAPVFTASGRPKIETKYNLVRLLLLLVLLYPFIMLWGIRGAALAVLLSVAISAGGMVVEAVHFLRCDWRHFLKMVVIPTISAFLMAVIILCLHAAMQNSYPAFFLLIFLGVLLYGIFTIIADTFFHYNIIKTLKDGFAMLIT